MSFDRSRSNSSNSSSSYSTTKARRQRRPFAFIAPVPGVGPTIQQRSIRRTRAKQSCDSCRKRKTRCNADETFPCSTCVSLGVECHLSEQKRRGPVPATYVEALEDRIKQLEDMLIKDKQEGHDNKIESSSSSCDQEKAVKARPSASSSTISNETTSNVARAASSDSLADDLNSLKLSDYNTTLYIGCSAGYYMLDQEAFVSKRGGHVDHREIVQKVNDEQDEHVIIKSGGSEQPCASSSPASLRGSSGGGDFSGSTCQQRRFEPFADIPNMTLELADSMIELYFRYVHVAAPLVNKIGFLEQYYFQNPQPPDEYLLYTICAVACHFMIKEKDLNTRYKITVDTIRSLHQCFQTRAQKLLETVFRRSKLSTVSALVLLASFVNMSQGEDDDRLQWFMCGTAIRMAQDLGLHRSSARWRLPEHEIELRRRIWYCAYILDREISAELGRPLTILEDDYDVELPSPYETPCSYGSHTRDVDENEPIPSLLLEAYEDLREQRPTYSLFICYMPLSRTLGQILGYFYSAKVQPSERNDKIDVAKRLSNEMDEWARDAQDRLLHYPFTAASDSYPTKDEFLNMYYHCLKLLIYRSFISDRDTSNIDFALQALSACMTSAIAIVDGVERMEAIGPTSMPWNFISYAIFQSAIMFLFNVKGEDEFLRQVGAKNLARCANIYARDDELRESRPAQVLMSLAAKYSVPVDTTNVFTSEGSFMNMMDNDNQTTMFSSTSSPSLLVNGATTRPSPSPDSNAVYVQQQPYATSNAINMHAPPPPPPPMNEFNSQQVPMMMNSAPQSMPMAPGTVPMSDVQFDIAGLSSELALWEFPTAITWNEWNPYLHEQQQ
ncbi:hypothetical protein K492DRAFT_208357 [Lichtheimia hyalospora FSU 10163]|nr:hypothetical protein K492DRAFT_208357 [Lichtheimia hyalospora FSU 10163]